MATNGSTEPAPGKATEGELPITQAKPPEPMTGDYELKVLEPFPDPIEHSAPETIMTRTEAIGEIGVLKQNSSGTIPVAPDGQASPLQKFKAWKHRKAFIHITIWVLLTMYVVKVTFLLK